MEKHMIEELKQQRIDMVRNAQNTALRRGFLDPFSGKRFPLDNWIEWLTIIALGWSDTLVLPVYMRMCDGGLYCWEYGHALQDTCALAASHYQQIIRNALLLIAKINAAETIKELDAIPPFAQNLRKTEHGYADI
jgi:hypothetical protein